MKHNRGKKRKIFLAGFLFALIVVLLFMAMKLQQQMNGKITDVGSSPHALQEQMVLTHNGQDYLLKKHIRTVLVLGTDKFISQQKMTDMDLFYNDMQADFQTLLVFDTEAKTCTPIQINRDTMCDVYWLSVNGKVGGTKHCQIALSHTYGSGKQDSCVNAKNTFSHLLFDAPVENYVAITMDAVGLLNDLVDGVTVSVPDDAVSYADPAFFKGNIVHLKGEQALRFVRARDTAVDDSNITRMARQKEFMEGFLRAAQKCSREQESFTLKAYEALESCMTTDLTVNGLDDLAQMLAEYEMLPLQTPTGELRGGEYFAEFYADGNSLWSIVEKAYCKE